MDADHPPAVHVASWATYVLSGLVAVVIATLVFFQHNLDCIGQRDKSLPVLADGTWWNRQMWFWALPIQDMPAMILLGYQKYSQKDQIWTTWIMDRRFHILPMSMLEEVKSLPPDKASFMRLVDGIFVWSAHTGDVLKERHHIAALKKHLIPRIPNMIGKLACEVDMHLSQKLNGDVKSGRGWTIHNSWDLMLEMSFSLLCNLLIDGEVGRSSKFIHSASEYCRIIPIWMALRITLPSFLQRATPWILPPTWIIHRHLHRIYEMVIPEIQSRREQPAQTFDVLQALLDHADSLERRPTDEDIVNQMLFVLFAGAELFAVVLCQILHHILANSDHRANLLEEVEMAAQGLDGWNKAGLGEMVKLDSFIREALRLSPPILCTTQRTILQDVKLSDGRELRSGDNVMFPTRAVLSDPQIYHDPNLFDPDRFLDADRTGHMPQAVTQTKDYTVFGYGQQSCPGRFYGVVTAKLVVAKLLLSYDMRFVPERKGRPVDCPKGVQLGPNMDTFVAFRTKRNS